MIGQTPIKCVSEMIFVCIDSHVKVVEDMHGACAR